jgi:hypothetical protein
MGYSGAVPSEHSSGGTTRRGAITKTGNSHLRRVLVEAAWTYRHRPRLYGALRARQENIEGSSGFRVEWEWPCCRARPPLERKASRGKLAGRQREPPETPCRLGGSLLSRASRPYPRVRRQIEVASPHIEASARLRETVRRRGEDAGRQCLKEFPQCERAERQCELAGRRFSRAGPLCTSISRHREPAQPPGELGRRKWELAFPHFQSKRQLGELAARECEQDFRPCKQSQRKDEEELPR